MNDRRNRYLTPPPAGLDPTEAADVLLRSSIRRGDHVIDAPGITAAPVLAVARRHCARPCPHARAMPRTEGGPWVVDIDRRVVGCYDCISLLTTYNAGPLGGVEPLAEDECAFCGATGVVEFAGFTIRVDRVLIVGNRCTPCYEAWKVERAQS